MNSTVSILLSMGLIASAATVQASGNLHEAAARNDMAALERMVAAGADIDERSVNADWRPSHQAADANCARALTFLLEYGADANARDNQGDTPLVWAEAYEHHELARLLYARGGRRRD